MGWYLLVPGTRFSVPFITTLYPIECNGHIPCSLEIRDPVILVWYPRKSVMVKVIHLNR